jgi:hypothetical protein
MDAHGWSGPTLDAREEIPEARDRARLDTRTLDDALTGEVFLGVHGELLAIFHFHGDVLPPVGELQAALERRVQADGPRQHGHFMDLRLAGWRGDVLAPDGGHLEADIFAARHGTWNNVGVARLAIILGSPATQDVVR